MFRNSVFFFVFYLFVNLLCYSSSIEKKPILIIEPSFYHHPIETRIPGAKKTVIAAGWIDPTGKNVFSFLEPSWKTIRFDWMKHFVDKGKETLSDHLDLIHPRLLRDEHQVIEVAILESSDPLTASTILAPNFGQQFVSIFGPEMLIAIPSATRIYIFSKLASSLDVLAPLLREEYKLARTPLSLEIFELDFKLGEGALHAVGSLESL